MNKLLQILKSVGIWLLCFIGTIILSMIISPEEMAMLASMLCMLIATVTAAHFAPLYGLFGRRWNSFVILLRCSFSLLCALLIMLSIGGLIWDKEIPSAFGIFTILVTLAGTYLPNAKYINPFFARLAARSRSHRTKVSNPPAVPKVSAPESPRALPRRSSGQPATMARIDRMDGHDFERFSAALLRSLGYENVEVTAGSGDQGVDILAKKDGIRYAIQCKRYAQKLGNKPIQEVHAGKTIYGCTVAAVLTNSYFTEGGKEAARALGVELWDRDRLKKMLTYAEHMKSRSLP